MTVNNVIAVLVLAFLFQWASIVNAKRLTYEERDARIITAIVAYSLFMVSVAGLVVVLS